MVLSLQLLCLFNHADAAKNRGWLRDGQLVRGTRPSTRSGYGLAVIADADLAVLFGGDVQGSKHLCSAPRALATPGYIALVAVTPLPRGFVLQVQEMMCTF